MRRLLAITILLFAALTPAAGAYWQPPAKPAWYWQLTGTVRMDQPLPTSSSTPYDVTGGPGTPPAATCTRWASTTGSDAAAGTSAAPYRTVQKLVGALGAGDTGCLTNGTYTDGGAEYIARIANGGTSGAPITLRSAPGQHATIRGVIYIVNGANNVTLSDLTLDGRPSSGMGVPSPQIMAADTILERDEITNGSTSICAILGNTDGYGRAVRTIIRHNQFHDCGTTANGMHDHSIYVEATDGAQITANTFARSSAFAIQFYPDAQNTLVSRNVMYDNGGGVIFAGEGGLVSNNNIVELNVIAHSTIRPGISAWWGGAIGAGNIARTNCLYDNSNSDVELNDGFVASGNVHGDPRFVDAAAGDFRLGAGSPCLALFGVTGQSGTGPLIYDVDGTDTSAATVSALHAQGRKVIAYYSAGSWENWRPDASSFPAVVKGSNLDGWAGEKWLDIRRLDILEPIMRNRFAAAKAKGFDGIEPDNIDGYANASGFPLTASNQLAYNRMLARVAHELDMFVMQKNDLGQTVALQPSFDGLIVEECARYSECNLTTPYRTAGKPVLQAEYGTVKSAWAADANTAGRMLAFTNLALNGNRWLPQWTATGLTARRRHPSA